MISLAKLSIRRPQLALTSWLVTAVVLTLIGLGVSHSLSPSVTIVPSTQSSQAQKLATAQFGPTQLVPIMLEGPKAQLNRVGPKLVIALTKRPHTRVLSAWDVGSASAGLRPSPTAAMVVVSVDRTETDVVKYDQPQIEQLVSHTIGTAPIKSYISGQPSIDRALKDASLNNLRQTELIAIAILFVLLLVGLRAPVAAVIITALGAFSILSSFVEVALLGKFMKLDPIGVAAGSMTGLAIAVGFSLLILDRFHREEYPEGMHPRHVATAALRELESTGKAVLVGGTGLIIALALVAVIGPTELMVSVGTGALTCATFATGGAVVVMPAALVLLGRRIDWMAFPAPRLLGRAWARLVDGGNWVTRNAVYAGFAATVLLGALAVPAFALHQGQPTVTQLPKDAKARIAFQEITRVVGAGYATPFSVIVVAHNRPITTPALLASIDQFQRQIAKDKTVYSVIGPGAINPTATQLKKFGPGLVKSAKISNQSKKDLVKLIKGLGQAGSGSAQLKSGLKQAVSGANQLHGGSGQAQSGAAQLHAGLLTAKTGSAQLSGGLDQALSGADQLKTGAAEALAGSGQLTQGISLAQTPASQSLPALSGLSGAASNTYSTIAGAAGNASGATNAVDSARHALESMSVGRKDPNYTAALGALNTASGDVSSVSSQIAAAKGTAYTSKVFAAALAYQAPGLFAALNMLHDGASQLSDGIAKLRDGNSQLANGIGQLANGGGQLHGGLGLLSNGAGLLEAGLVQLTAGTGQLAYGLSAAPGGAGQLVTGLGQMQAAVTKARGQIPSTKDLEALFKQSPGMFSSGYFVLAAVAGSKGSDRNAATFAINLDRGGTAGQIVVTSKYPLNDPRTAAMRNRLVALAAAFGKRQNTDVAVGGPGGNITDLTNLVKDRIPVVIGVLAGALLLVLIVALRSVVLPIVTIAFNLLVVGAAFGVIQELFGGSNPPLGGPGYLDPISTISIFTVAFGISVAYSTLLLMRTREAYVAGVGGHEAVRIGLRETAAPTTGAGLVMIAALIPFATTDLINIRELGIGIAVAILLDIVLVRPVLLSAAEAVLGRLGWWPTSPARPTEPPKPGQPRARRVAPRLPRLHLPQRRPGPAHQ